MKKYALVLGGGGAKGAYQAGVLKALEEANILQHVHLVSGTSIGAINAFLLMNGLSSHDISKIWFDFNNDEIYGKNNWSSAFSVLGLYNTTGIFKKIEKYLDESAFKRTTLQGYVTLAKVPSKGFLSKLSVKNYEKEYVHLNSATDPLAATMASAAIPIVFGEKKFEGESYVDGGLVDNFPFEPVLNAGANVIFSIGLSSKYVQDVAHPVKTIIDFTPLEDFGAMPKAALDFNAQKLTAYYKQGYEAGMLMINYLRTEKMFNIFKKIKRKKGRIYNMADVLEK